MHTSNVQGYMALFIVHKIILEINATSLRDMGKVMNSLKEKYSGKMDFGKAGTFAKDALTK